MAGTNDAVTAAKPVSPGMAAVVFETMNILLLFLISILPSPEPLRERCDRIEVNHFYDDDRRLVFDQLLFWDWSHDAGRFQLRAWRMVKSPGAIPQYSHSRRCWQSNWYDGDLWRCVEAECVTETWTQYDPELTDREFLPKEHRRELRRPTKGK